ncbi:MAG: HdeD family acid-resistance protein [Atopobiaceae bacterium]
MEGYKILNMVLGALMVISGLYCCMNPGLTTLSLGWVVGFVMIVNAIARLSTYGSRRKLGYADGWSLAASIISLCFGILLCASNAMGVAASLMIVYLTAAWVFIGGILNISRAISLQRMHGALNTSVIGANWGWVLAMGILMLVVGIWSFIDPQGLIVAIGFLIGVELICMGANLFVASSVL